MSFIKWRQGNPVPCTFLLNINNEPMDIPSDAIFYFRSVNHSDCQIEMKNVQITGNKATFTWPASKQRVLGQYRLFIECALNGAPFIQDMEAVDLVAFSKEVTEGEGCPAFEVEPLVFTPNFDTGIRLTDAVVQKDSYLEFPTIGNEATIYIDRTANKSFRWDNDGLKYYVVGSDYKDISVVDAGTASKTI